MFKPSFIWHIGRLQVPFLTEIHFCTRPFAFNGVANGDDYFQIAVATFNVSQIIAVKFTILGEYFSRDGVFVEQMRIPRVGMWEKSITHIPSQDMKVDAQERQMSCMGPKAICKVAPSIPVVPMVVEEQTRVTSFGQEPLFP